jgi:hypothetical protein
MPRAWPPTQAPARASAHRDPFRRPFRIPPKYSTVRRPVHAEGAGTEARVPQHTRSGAQSRGAPSPGGAAIQRSRSRGMRPRRSVSSFSQRPTAHRTHLSAHGGTGPLCAVQASPGRTCDLGRHLAGGFQKNRHGVTVPYEVGPSGFKS